MPRLFLKISEASMQEIVKAFSEYQYEAQEEGLYYLCKGKCMYNTERLPGAHIQMNISELTNRILQPLKPYMSLMLN